MTNIIRFLIYFFSFIDFIFLLFIFIFLIKKIIIDSKRLKTSNRVSSLGRIIAIVGDIRVGKTSFSSGLIHEEEIKIIDNLYEIMNEAINRLSFIDFNFIDNLILENSTKSIKEINIIIFNNCTVLGSYTDFLSIKSMKETLSNYIEAYYNLFIRNNYVRSKTFFYSRNTNSSAKKLDTESLELRNILVKRNFCPEKDMIIFEDELSLDRGNIKSNSKEDKTTGIKDLKALFGHIYEERNYWIQIKQNATDEIKCERSLSQKHIEIISKTSINPYNFLKRVFNMYYKLFSFRYLLKEKIKLAFILNSAKRSLLKNYYYKQTSFLRNQRKIKYIFNSFVDSLGFLIYKVAIYSKADDVGKLLEKYFTPEVFIFPIKHCYGTYQNHEYSSLFNFLENYSDYSTNEKTLYWKSQKKGFDQANKIFDMEEVFY